MNQCSYLDFKIIKIKNKKNTLQFSWLEKVIIYWYFGYKWLVRCGPWTLGCNKIWSFFAYPCKRRRLYVETLLKLGNYDKKCFSMSGYICFIFPVHLFCFIGFSNFKLTIFTIWNKDSYKHEWNCKYFIAITFSMNV